MSTPPPGTLTPSQAAQIAAGVYGLQNRTIEQAIARGVPLGYEGLFQTDAGSRLTGTSGGFVGIKQLSGFGYMARREGQHHQGEILVATRGTVSNFDWLSNLNIGIQAGPSGLPVHAGFNEVWKSLASQMRTFLRGRDYSLVHCVGHSLGGALATLSADHFSSLGASVRLYTFGSPRVGTALFSRSLSARVGAHNIHRVYHRSDPVPMIPLFPFVHVPWGIDGYAITTGLGGLINSDAHNMEESYQVAMVDRTWTGLGRASSAYTPPAQAWLDYIGANANGVIPGSGTVLRMIGKALLWLLEQIGQLISRQLGLGLAASMTVLDQLAWLLAQGARASLEVSRYIGYVIAAIFRFLGRTAVTGANLSRDFIRWVLRLLFDALAAVARRALPRGT